MRQTSSVRRVRCLLSVCGVLALACVARAEEGPADEAAGSGAIQLSEVTVTAQRRAENQQKVPVAVTVIDPKQIESRPNFTALDIPALAPGVNAQDFNGDRSLIFFSIRGQSYTTGTLYPSVIPYFSEVPLTKLVEGTFFDLGNIQVLRGPQGTLFGRVTNGGAVLLEPAKPSYQLNGYVTQKLGSYDLHTTTAALNIPLIAEKLAVRVAYERGRQNGYIKNEYTGRDLNNVDYDAGRVSILFNPTESLENLLIAYYNYANDNGTSERLAYVNQPAVIANLTPLLGAATASAEAANLAAAAAREVALGPTRTSENFLVSNNHHILYIVDKARADLTEKITLRNIFGYTHFKQFNLSDYDGSDISYLHIGSNRLPGQLDDREQFSEELQLLGKSFDDRLDWVVGGYGDENRNGGPTESDAQIYDLLHSVNVQSEAAKSKAVYGQASYSLGGFLSDVKIHGGGRYTWDRISGSGASYVALLGLDSTIPYGQCLGSAAAPPGLLSFTPCISQSTRSGTFTYNAGVDYQVTPLTMVYAKISRGYRPGGFNIVPQGYQTSYQPEFDLSREIGLKSDWALGEAQLRTNIAAFYDSYTSIQTRVNVPVNNVGYSAVVNGPDAVVEGVELEATFEPVRELILTARYALEGTHNETSGYATAYLEAACPADPLTTARDITKVCPYNKVSRVPRHKLDMDATLLAPIAPALGALSFTASLHYISSQDSIDTNYFNPDSRMAGYTVADAHADWTKFLGSPVDLSMFCTNLANATYVTSRGSVSEMGSIGISKLTYGPPRMIGASITYRFNP
jgi:iron complex outermembrane receptor protein